MENVFIDNNIAVITGAADGVGLAACKKFQELGMQVCMLDNNEEQLEKAAQKLDATKTKTFTVDVSNIDQLKTVQEKIIKDYGKVNVLMNNAGISRPTKDWSEIEN